MPSDLKSVLAKYSPQLIFLAAALSILLPLFFERGFLFLLDMVWGPNFPHADLASNLPAHYPLLLILGVFDRFLPLEFIQKTLLLFILFSCGMSSFQLTKNLLPRNWALLCGLFYMLNPFVFERLAAGHWLVLAGYALFPLVVLLFLRFLKSTREKDLWVFAVSFALYPIVSPHWAYVTAFFLPLVALVYAFKARRLRQAGKPAYAKPLKSWLYFLLLQLLLFFVINYFWIRNYLTPGRIVSGVPFAEFAAFQTATDPARGIYFNVLSLYGFWQTSFLLPKDVFAFWWMILPVVLVFSLLGIYYLIRTKRSSLAVAATVFSFPAFVIAVGFGTIPTAEICAFLLRYLPGFGLLRETEKLTGFLAFAYALFFPAGILFGAQWLQKKAPEKFQRFVHPLAWLFSFGLICLSVVNIFWAFNGQLKAYQYPNSWSVADNLMNTAPDSSKALFLPWHGYMPLSFAGQSIVANPGPQFFRIPTIYGQNLENKHLSDIPQGEWSARLIGMLRGETTLDESLPYLNEQKVKYIILAKTYDFGNYAFLDRSSNLKKIYDADEIALYRIP